jgi:hypothetical protein
MTRVDLSVELTIHFQRFIPDSTLWRWLQDCAIGAKSDYSQEDLEALKVYGLALKVRRCRDFAIKQVGEYQRGNYQSSRANSTIDVNAQAV